MNSVYIWKYEYGNYFEGIEFIDKIVISKLPIDSFPIFNLTTEEVNGIAEYKAGDFDLRLIVDGNERSFNGHTIDRFFRGGPGNFKFLAGIQIGAKQFWGTSTNEYIKYNYINRVIEITCAAMETELRHQLSNSTVGLLNNDRTFDDFLLNVLLPADVQHLNVSKSFGSYRELIGDANVVFKSQLERSMSIVGKRAVWDSFIELMVGTGLNYKVKYQHEEIITGTNYPQFNLFIFSLEHLTPCNSALQIIEAEELTLFRRLPWLFIRYRSVDISAYYSDIDIKIWDGAAINSGTIHATDKLRPADPASPLAQWGAPCFLTADSSPGRISVIMNYPVINELLYIDKDTRLIDLPLYSYTYPFEGFAPPLIPGHTQGRSIAFCRCLNGNNWSFSKVQDYAVKQYKRYTGGFAKKVKRLKVLFDENSDYELWKTVVVTEESGIVKYYISEINNIDLMKQECELLLVEV